MLNLNDVLATGTHFIDRNDVTNAPQELMHVVPFKLTVTNPKGENAINQDISGTDSEGRAIRCIRNGWRLGMRVIQWDGWNTKYTFKQDEPMNVKVMTDAEIEMNLSRLNTEMMERTIKKVMGTIPGPDIAGIVAEEIAKATTKKPEPRKVHSMNLVINGLPTPVEKLDVAEIWKKALAQSMGERYVEFKRPEPQEVSLKWAGTEQELAAILEEAATQSGHIMKVPALSEGSLALAQAKDKNAVADYMKGHCIEIIAPTEPLISIPALSEEGIEKAAVEAHLDECKECRIEHMGKLGYALFEINQLIARHTHPDALKALEKEKAGIQREINKYNAM